ncbi:hypothetical protein [Mesorhizobium sp. ZC-5]|uniref:hypothetical protein n=1 Tax=Mesorhizobium sp. ZC-5 TaxID=2986066 RepID=UPI0021E9037C|nr:hypothetical protein [Mesorhizobium sp. ZC-5]MCV3240878.1 hypothetical protein [Mesorhizobium sp. ZC-5]
MTARLRLSIALALAMIASAAGGNETSDFPAVDSAGYCRMIMDSNPASSLTPGLFDTCMSGEKDAEHQALARWDAASSDIKTQCRSIAKLGDHYSYGLILGCIRYLEQKI